MRIFLNFHTNSKPRRKVTVIPMTVPNESVTLVHLRKLWEFEQFLNTQFQGCDTSVKIDIVNE